ncbi:NAD(P)H-binding protein [Nocardia uniformis]|uniref:NAD(P)H-binding protein n=1 Tax=Nocardia uniformis TaxID=53432 RepID=A0A849CHL6_9NOCA|nr:NAD(P)-binding oxidoreductase [Nocardia uniformis]NNH73161.1 NAD(P)H-binding protein [Nocardia uniformis]
MKVLVIGSTGGSGRAAVDHLLSAGHDVTAFARHPERLETRSPRLRLVSGNALDPADVERAVEGHDAVVVTLGITENPLRVRILGPAHTPIDIRSTGTRQVVAAMRRHSVRKLVVLSAFGVAETRPRLDLVNKLFFRLVLKPQIADTERQEQAVRDSELDWVLVRPVNLTDGPEDAMPATSTTPERRKVSRNSVGRFLARAVEDSTLLGRHVTVSGPRESSDLARAR